MSKPEFLLYKVGVPGQKDTYRDLKIDSDSDMELVIFQYWLCLCGEGHPLGIYGPHWNDHTAKIIDVNLCDDEARI